MSDLGVYYRYDDFLESSGGYDQSGEWEPGPSSIRVAVRQYEIVKKTPKGAWILNDMGERQLILDHWYCKFANPTLEGARQDFLARKRKLIAIAKRRIRDARIAVETVKRNEFETYGIRQKLGHLKRVYSWEIKV